MCDFCHECDKSLEIVAYVAGFHLCVLKLVVGLYYVDSGQMNTNCWIICKLNKSFHIDLNYVT